MFFTTSRVFFRMSRNGIVFPRIIGIPRIILPAQMLIRMALSNFYGQTNFRQG